MFYVKRSHERKVKRAEELAADFHHKCYICECEGTTSPDIEHRIPWTFDKSDPSLLEGWNLFYSCHHCNSDIKRDGFSEKSEACTYGRGYLGVIDCTKCDPNNYIVLTIDVDGHVDVMKKAGNPSPPCFKLTKDLLEKVYGSNSKMREDKLVQLIDGINKAISPVMSLIRRLRNFAHGSCSDDQVAECRAELLCLVNPKKPFFAFKLSFLREEYESAKNGSKIKSILADILADASLLPATPVGHCVHSGQAAV